MNIYYECSICGYRNLNRKSVETCENNHTKKEEGGMPILCEVTKQFPIKDSNCECDGCKVYKALSKK